jgi:hypothetical protein
MLRLESVEKSLRFKIDKMRYIHELGQFLIEFGNASLLIVLLELIPKSL